MKNLFDPLNDLRGKNICGIYHIQIGEHNYIGSSFNIKKRLRAHRTMLRNNKHYNKFMQNSFNKNKSATYDIKEIIDYKIDSLDLRKIESSWIKISNTDLNLDDPVSGIGGYHEKMVYQYNLNGDFIKEWKSAMYASEELNIPYAGIHSCANPNTVVKSSSGFVWSYDKKDKIKYSNNTGENLDRTEVHVFSLDNKYIKSYPSLSNFARQLAKDIDYKSDWKNLRSTIGYALHSPKTRTVRKMYKVSYQKDFKF